MSELGLQVLDLPGPGAELFVRWALPDAGERPADGFRPAARDARGDQQVQRLQVLGPEPGHDRRRPWRGPFATAARVQQLDERALAALFWLAARDDLEHHGDRKLVQVLPQLAEGLVVRG